MRAFLVIFLPVVELIPCLIYYFNNSVHSFGLPPNFSDSDGRILRNSSQLNGPKSQQRKLLSKQNGDVQNFIDIHTRRSESRIRSSRISNPTKYPTPYPSTTSCPSAYPTLVSTFPFPLNRRVCEPNDTLHIGHWEIYDKVHKSFFCCSLRSGGYTSISILGHCGNATHRHEFNGSKDHNPPGWSACSCDKIQGVNSVSPREKYHWRPRDCDLLRWDAEMFCSALGNRTILLVGDSTMQQSAVTLMSMVTTWFVRRSNVTNSCAEQIVFGLSDLLSVEHGKKFGTEIERGHSLMNLVHRYNPDILVVTTGAHFKSLPEFQKNAQIVIESLKKLEANGFHAIKESALARFNNTSRNLSIAAGLVPNLLQQKPRLHVAWKSQNPGHPGCLDKRLPYADLGLAMREVATAHQSEDKYYWRLHPYFDWTVQGLTRGTNISYIDMRPLYMRPDSHQSIFDPSHDCLHFCLPGPVDLFSIYMLHYIIGLNARDVVE